MGSVTGDTVRVLLLLMGDGSGWGACLMTDHFHPLARGIRLVAVEGWDHEAATVFQFPEKEAFMWAEDHVASNKLPFVGAAESRVPVPPTEGIGGMDVWAGEVIATILRDRFDIDAVRTRVSPPGGW